MPYSNIKLLTYLPLSQHHDNTDCYWRRMLPFKNKQAVRQHRQKVIQFSVSSVQCWKHSKDRQLTADFKLLLFLRVMGAWSNNKSNTKFVNFVQTMWKAKYLYSLSQRHCFPLYKPTTTQRNRCRQKRYNTIANTSWIKPVSYKYIVRIAIQ